MAINREPWKLPFRTDSTPLWNCPTCRVGFLQLIPDTFKKYETASSKEGRGSQDWEPSWFLSRFTAAFKCNNKKCGDVNTCAGEGIAEEYVDEDVDGHPDVSYRDVFWPGYFALPLEIFPIPEKCPKEVGLEITNSFKIYFADPSAALNHIRSAVEELLTHLKVKKFDRIDGKLKQLTLDHRIRIYESRNKSIADKLLAIKWLGNAASHPGGISKDDVLDSYEILDFVLSSLFNPMHRKLERLVSLLNRKKGPTRKGQNA